MALPSSGALKLSDVNVELGLGSTTQRGLGQATTRSLYGVASGAIRLAADGYGKSNRVALSYTYSASAVSPSLDITTISGYSAGKSDITITVNGGIYLYATSTGTPGLTLSGGSSGDTVTVVNNGFIMGMGGVGAKGLGGPPFRRNGNAGGIALQLGFNTTVNNTNGSAYIGGGGGGGGSEINGAGGGAGGAAGGGSYGATNGGSGGGIGSSGSNGGVQDDGENQYYGGGGGGGRIFPGSTAGANAGGQAGGGGGGYGSSGVTNGGSGGGGSSVGGSSPSGGSGGGGGWGASGGTSSSGGSGGSGGKAVNLNGYSVTWTSGDTTRVYGSVA